MSYCMGRSVCYDYSVRYFRVLTDTEKKDLQERADIIAAYEKRVVGLFDCFVAQGQPLHEATRSVSRALAKEGHPWCDYDLVRHVISATGRLRRRKLSPGTPDPRD